MGVNLNSDVAKLSQILSTLETKTDNLSESELLAVISRIGQRLKDLDAHSQAGFTPLTQKLLNDICILLKKIDGELRTCQVQSDKSTLC